MINTLVELYAVFISFLAFTLAVACIFVWIIMMVNKKQEEKFDEKYRRTRKHEGYKSGR
jgi:NADH:ubiquinone oxidoreductase subunit 6 (subunit J)